MSAQVESSAPAPKKKVNPFGAARTREEILASRGVDVKKVENDLDARARMGPRLTKVQEEELTAAQQEIKYEESQLEQAGTEEEKAACAAKVAAKKQEVDELAAKFKAANIAKAKEDKAKGRPQFMRPSERRRQREEGGGGGEQSTDFSSFGGGRGGGRRQAAEGCKLYVGNLSFDMTKEQLDELFAPYGKTTDTFLPTERETGRPRGFAFVTYSSPAEAQAAIAGVDGMEVDGRQLRVNVSDGGGGGGGGGGY